MKEGKNKKSAERDFTWLCIRKIKKQKDQARGWLLHLFSDAISVVFIIQHIYVHTNVNIYIHVNSRSRIAIFSSEKFSKYVLENYD